MVTAPHPAAVPQGRPSRAFIVVGLIFVCLLAAAGVRSTPGVLMVPLETAFGWSRDTTSAAAAIGIFLYGLVGPFAAGLMQTVGIRRTLMGGLALMGLASLLSAFMTQGWQLVLFWGVLSGLGSGCVAMVLGAAIVTRWFHSHRGLVMGLLTASTATGTLIFLPVLAAIAQHWGWRPVVLTLAAVMGALVPVVFFLLPEKPAAVGLAPYGAPPGFVAAVHAPANPFGVAIGALRRGMRSKVFWLLFATFFICGFTTNGLIGTHLIALCGDHGIPQVEAAGWLALMGLFDLVGTTGSGWLTDRYDPRKLLFIYYGIRGLALVLLPFSDFSNVSLAIFAVFYGLDWIATVPPTLKLANAAFGDRDAPVIFGWIAAGHQIGAASAAFLAGVLRAQTGSYLDAFVISGLTGLIAAVLALLVAKSTPRLQPA